MIFDTHAHYEDSRFDLGRDNIIAALPEAGIGLVLNIGCNVPRSEQSVQLAAKYDFIYSTVGIHPHDAQDSNVNDIGDLASLPKVKAIGEIGLDYYYDNVPKDAQKKCFTEQMDLAQSLDLPVVLHDRDAHEDCLQIVKMFPKIRGVCHCFSGSLEFAKILVKLGWSISFTGNITFKNARKACEVAAWLPKDRIMVETDCPYMSPEPNRGKRNDSANLKYIIAKIAELRGVTNKEIEDITWNNGKQFFGI